MKGSAKIALDDPERTHIAFDQSPRQELDMIEHAIAKVTADELRSATTILVRDTTDLGPNKAAILKDCIGHVGYHDSVGETAVLPE